MTPRQKHGHELREDLIVHEIGHAVVGYELGIAEGGIELRHPSTGELARARYSRISATPRSIMIRGLAGSFVQANIASDHLDAHLRDHILRGTLFAGYKEHLTNRTVPSAVIAAGFYGDWERVILTAEEFCSNIDDILCELDAAYTKLLAIYNNGSVKDKVMEMRQDFIQWLDEDNPTIAVAPMLIYPPDRLLKILKGSNRFRRKLRHPKGATKQPN